MRRRSVESLPGLIGYEMRRLWSSDLEALWWWGFGQNCKGAVLKDGFSRVCEWKLGVRAWKLWVSWETRKKEGRLIYRISSKYGANTISLHNWLSALRLWWLIPVLKYVESMRRSGEELKYDTIARWSWVDRVWTARSRVLLPDAVVRYANLSFHWDSAARVRIGLHCSGSLHKVAADERLLLVSKRWACGEIREAV